MLAGVRSQFGIDDVFNPKNPVGWVVDPFGARFGIGSATGLWNPQGGLVQEDREWQERMIDKQHQWALDAEHRATVEQRRFAKRGLQWRAEDAKAAGLHPLAAVGSAGPSFSPSYSFSADTTPVPVQRDTWQDKMGQSISRALDILGLQRAMLQNRLLESEIAEKDRKVDLSIGPWPYWAGSGIIPGQANGGGFGSTVPHPDRPAQEAGYKPDVAYSMGDNGRVYAYLPQALSESYEDDPHGRFMWNLRNKYMPAVNPWTKSRPPLKDLPPGYEGWQSTGFTMGWKPVKRMPRRGWWKWWQKKGVYDK